MRALPRHRQVAAWAEVQAAIHAVLVVGSRARTEHPTDAWSDPTTAGVQYAQAIYTGWPVLAAGIVTAAYVGLVADNLLHASADSRPLAGVDWRLLEVSYGACRGVRFGAHADRALLVI